MCKFDLQLSEEFDAKYNPTTECNKATYENNNNYDKINLIQSVNYHSPVLNRVRHRVLEKNNDNNITKNIHRKKGKKYKNKNF